MTDLFDWKPPPPALMTEPRAHKGVATSEAAARSMRKCSGPMQIKILSNIARHPGGATYDEVCHILLMEKPTVSGRINDLSSAGFIEHPAGNVRLTRSRRPAKVYFVTESGKELLRSVGRWV